VTEQGAFDDTKLVDACHHHQLKFSETVGIVPHNSVFVRPILFYILDQFGKIIRYQWPTIESQF
jgi:hypothetical protein